MRRYLYESRIKGGEKHSPFPLGSFSGKTFVFVLKFHLPIPCAGGSYLSSTTSPLPALPPPLIPPFNADHPLLLAFPPSLLTSPSLPPPPLLLAPLAPDVLPAIQAAMSKFCSGFPPVAPVLRMLFFCCSSNSARVSGSTAGEKRFSRNSM